MRILRANKSGFLSAAPFVWKKVDGVVHLLKLLPRLQIVNDKSNKIEKIVSFIFVQNTSHLNGVYLRPCSLSLKPITLDLSFMLLS